MSDLYDTDIALWSEQQARLLRRHAAGKPVNNDDLDWQNIAEEIESLAKSDRREIRNRLAVDLHAPVEVACPAGGKGGGWRGPGGAFPGYPLSRGHQVVASRDAAVLRSACRTWVAQFALSEATGLVTLWMRGP